jgi:hypothetical protein|tara:strand:- start:287 stop:505 length:219 start_codon:yes stop_codon:yes gene_type:complete
LRCDAVDYIPLILSSISKQKNPAIYSNFPFNILLKNPKDAGKTKTSEGEKDTLLASNSISPIAVNFWLVSKN